MRGQNRCMPRMRTPNYSPPVAWFVPAPLPPALSLRTPVPSSLRSAKPRKPLPKPRYGRYVPEGSPPRSQTASPPQDSPTGASTSYQSPAPAPAAYPSSSPSFVQPQPSLPQHFIPYPGGARSSGVGAVGEARGSNGAPNGGERGPPAASTSRLNGERAGGLNGAGERKEKRLERIGGAVGDFREKVRERGRG